MGAHGLPRGDAPPRLFPCLSGRTDGGRFPLSFLNGFRFQGFPECFLWASICEDHFVGFSSTNLPK
jgi:hypothetical protein